MSGVGRLAMWTLVGVAVIALLLAVVNLSVRRASPSREEVLNSILVHLKEQSLSRDQIVQKLGPPDRMTDVKAAEWLLAINKPEYGSFDSKCVGVMEYDLEDKWFFLLPIWSSTTYQYVRIGLDKQDKVCAFMVALH